MNTPLPRYRPIVESAIGDASREGLIDLVREMADIADKEQARVIDRNACCRQLLGWGKNHDRERTALFGLIEICARSMTRAMGLSAITDFESREEYLRLVAKALSERVAAGIVAVEWPDESIFASSDAASAEKGKA